MCVPLQGCAVVDAIQETLGLLQWGVCVCVCVYVIDVDMLTRSIAHVWHVLSACESHVVHRTLDGIRCVPM